MATRRTKQEIIEALNAKIVYHEECINKLNARKEQANQPTKERVRKTSMRLAMSVIKESGITPDELLVLATKAKKAKGKAKE